MKVILTTSYQLTTDAIINHISVFPAFFTLTLVVLKYASFIRTPLIRSFYNWVYCLPLTWQS